MTYTFITKLSIFARRILPCIFHNTSNCEKENIANVNMTRGMFKGKNLSNNFYVEVIYTIEPT